MKKSLFVALFAALLMVAAPVMVTAAPVEKGPAGWYAKTNGADAGTLKYFKNGHPDNQSEWVYCDTCGDDPDNPVIVNNGGSSDGNAYSLAKSMGGSWLHENSNFAEVEVDSEDSDAFSFAHSRTATEFEGPGFVENIKPGGGLVVAGSYGSVHMDADNDVLAKIHNPTDPDGESHSSQCVYAPWWLGGRHLGHMYTDKTYFDGTGKYEFELGIDSEAYQYNGALAQIGLDGDHPTWAFGENSTGGSIDATFEGKGKLEADRTDWVLGYDHDGGRLDWLLNWEIEGTEEDPGMAFASLDGDIYGNGKTGAFAFRDRDADTAFSAAGAFTAGNSFVTIDSYFDGENLGCPGKRSFDADLTADGEGVVKHYSNAALPDNTVFAATYGQASFEYRNSVSMNAGPTRGLGDMTAGVGGSGYAATLGYSSITRTPTSLNVTSQAGAMAGTGMNPGYTTSQSFAD